MAQVLSSSCWWDSDEVRGRKPTLRRGADVRNMQNKVEKDSSIQSDHCVIHRVNRQDPGGPERGCREELHPGRSPHLFLSSMVGDEAGVGDGPRGLHPVKCVRISRKHLCPDPCRPDDFMHNLTSPLTSRETFRAVISITTVAHV